VKVNRVGVVPAALSAWEGIRLFKPDIILSIGTAGGVHARGVRQRSVYLSEHPVQYVVFVLA
jgi:nucleoside phosphorylase